MRRTLLTLALTLSCASSCAFVLDFDELQAGDEADAGASGGTAGAGGGPDGSAGTTGLSAEQLPGALAGAICLNLDACFGPAAELIYFEHDCQTLFESTLEDGLIAAAKNSLDAGRVTYDPVAAAACVKELEDASAGSTPKCADLDQLLENCKAVFGTLGGSGDECRYDFECQVGMHCANDNACPGQCAPKGSTSAPCLETSDCEVGLTCFGVSATTAGSCVPYIGVGQGCTRGGPSCQSGAFCFDKGSGGICQRLATLFEVADGNPCWDNNLFCKPGSVCMFTGLPFLSSATCVAKTEQAQDSCNWAFPDRCGKDLYCAVGSSQCLALPVENQPCAPAGSLTMQGNGLAPRCAGELACVNNVCKRYARLGETCEDGSQCYSGACATPTGGGAKVCVTAPCF